MINVLGAHRGVLGFFSVPNFDRFGSTFGPQTYKMPPPDSIWYDINDFVIDPIKIDVDFIDKVKSRTMLYKPVAHGSLEGTIRPPLMIPVSPLYRGTDSAYMVYEHGEFSPRDRWAANQRYGQLSTLVSLDNFDEEDTNRKHLLNGDIIVDNYYHDEPWRSLVYAYKTTFRSFSKPCVFQAEFCRDDCRKDGRELQPRVTGVPFCEKTTSNRVTVTVSHIRNVSGVLWVKGTYSYIRTETYWPDGNSYVFKSGVNYFDVPMAHNEVDWTGPPSISKNSFRGICDLIAGEPSIPKDMKIIRTKALITIEDLGTNNLENIFGLPGFGGILRTLVDGYAAFKSKNPLLMIKALADVHLVYKFAVQNSIRDFGHIRSFSARAQKYLGGPDGLSKRRASREFELSPKFVDISRSRYSSEFILRRNVDLESRIVDALDTLGLLPSATNTWDLFPLSFVVDWFVNIGDSLDAWSRMHGDAQHYTLIKRIESQKFDIVFNNKIVYTMAGSRWKSVGESRGRYYQRSIADGWGDFDLLSIAGGSGFGFSQIIDSAALIVQRL